jgi:hypothetical protein
METIKEYNKILDDLGVLYSSNEQLFIHKYNKLPEETRNLFRDVFNGVTDVGCTDTTDYIRETYYMYLSYYSKTRDFNDDSLPFTLKNPFDLAEFHSLLELLERLLDADIEKFASVFDRIPVIMWDKIVDLRLIGSGVKTSSPMYKKCLDISKKLSLEYSEYFNNVN